MHSVTSHAEAIGGSPLSGPPMPVQTQPSARDMGPWRDRRSEAQIWP
jgi:hypothetical protein